MRNQNQSKLAAMMATIFLAAAEAMAQDQQSAAAEEGEESKRRIVISIADRKLAVMEDGRVVKIYSTAVGADATPSPTGVFKIANRVPNPTWYGPHRKIVPPGKANPLGTRWMGLSHKGYGIHGTNNQLSIGHNVSHGCIRMRKADVEQLFEIVKVGDVVEMVAEPTAEMAWIFGTTETVASAE
jgi:lipoprotein-anchoring transpeptidase ErfK/SrfK